MFKDNPEIDHGLLINAAREAGRGPITLSPLIDPKNLQGFSHREENLRFYKLHLPVETNLSDADFSNHGIIDSDLRGANLTGTYFGDINGTRFSLDNGTIFRAHFDPLKSNALKAKFFYKDQRVVGLNIDPDTGFLIAQAQWRALLTIAFNGHALHAIDVIKRIALPYDHPQMGESARAPAFLRN